jgi:hypothetical protein
MLRPVHAGKSAFRPFHVQPSNEWLVLPYAAPSPGQRMELLPIETVARDAPNVAAWLRANEAKLRERTGAWTDRNWHSYSRRQNLERFEGPKVMVPSMLDRLCATHDEGGHFFVNVSTGGYGIGNDPALGASPAYVAALLNSELLTWVLKRMSRAWRGGWFEARKGNLERLPIAVPDPDAQDRVIALYEEVRRVTRASINAPDDQGARRVAAVAQGSFNHAVHELYGLTFQEIDVLDAR